jgi:tetratricopeptide (TPR) repeat protein
VCRSSNWNEQTAYHARLLYCTLQLVPGIEILFPPPAPGPPRPARFRRVKDLLRLVPQPALRLFLKAGGAKLLPLPGRQGNPKALEEFKKCREELTRVQQLEQDTAASNAEAYRPSRASCLLEQLIAVLSELAGGNKGDPIDYTAWLSLEAPDAPPEPVNAVDYFFIGLFNYFIAKRRDALLPKMLSLVHGTFPDLHARALLPNAERLLRSAVDLDRENFWAHWLLGRTLLEAKNYGAAELAFNAAIALQPRYARAWEQLALALGHQWTLTHDPRIYARAEAASRMALQLAAGDPSIFWPRGELYQLLRCENEAVAAFSNWLALEENIPSLISRSAGLGTLFELACRLLEDAPSGPKRAHAYALLALVYLTWAGWGETESPNQNQSEAVKAAEAALNLCSTHVHALTVLGVVRCQQATTDPAKALTAVEYLRRALDIDPLAYRAAFHLPPALALAGKNDERAAAWTDLLARGENAARQMDASAAPSPGQQVRELCPAWMIAHARRALAMEKPDVVHPR